MGFARIRRICLFAILFFVILYPMQTHAEVDFRHIFVSTTVSSGPQDSVYGMTWSLHEDNYITIGEKLYFCWDGIHVDSDSTVRVRITDPEGREYDSPDWNYKIGTYQFGYVNGYPMRMQSTVGEDGDTLYGWFLFSTGATSPSGIYKGTLYVGDQEKTINWYMIDTPVSITADPEDLSVLTGETANFQVQAKGSNLTYQWYYKDSNSSEGEVMIEGATSPAYIITDVPYRCNGRFYYCQVSNYSNAQNFQKVTLTTKPARLTVNKREPDVSAADSETVYDGKNHGIRVLVNGPSDYTVYYSTGGKLDQSDYLSGTITSPVRKDEGTTMVYYYVHDNQEIYEDFAGSAKITVLKDSTSQEVTTTQAPKKTTTVKKPELNKKGKLISVKSAKKGQLKIKWKKLTGITGYQIYISRNKKFTSHTLKKNFKKSKTGVTTGSWPSGRTIYVKMRPYKKKGGKRLFGYWSKVKKIRIK